jgi:hypothetical protein
MFEKDNDPDTLQCQDESNVVWVNAWKVALKGSR